MASIRRNTVLFRDPTNTGRRLVPPLRADCDLPDTLRRYKHADFRPEMEATLDELLAACRGEAKAVLPATQPGPRTKLAKPKATLAKPPDRPSR